jgi:hypothetical protein
MAMSKRTISLHVEGKYFYKWQQLWSFVLVVQNGPPVPDVIIFRARSERMAVPVSMIRLDLEPQIDKSTMTTTSMMTTMTPPTPTQIPASTPSPASTKCHFVHM